MPCSKRGQSGDLEYKKIIASPAGKVNRYSPTKIALGKKSCDRICGLFPGFSRVRGTGRSPPKYVSQDQIGSLAAHAGQHRQFLHQLRFAAGAAPGLLL